MLGEMEINVANLYSAFSHLISTDTYNEKVLKFQGKAVLLFLPRKLWRVSHCDHAVNDLCD